MKFPQNILVIVSGKRHTHFALNRALRFAQLYDIKLTLFSCVYDPGTEMSPILSASAKEAIRNKKLENRQQYLENIKAGLSKHNIPVETKVVWHRKVQNAVVEECEKLQPDLVVKRISESASSINPFNMPMDWQLLRKCPRPILLVNAEEWQANAPIIVAVDASSTNDKEIQLNKRLINYGKMLSKIIDSETHVVTTHINPVIDNAIDLPNFDLNDLKTQVKTLNSKNLSKLVSDYNIPENNQHVLEGLAEDMIPKLSQQLGAQLVIMGSVGRRGLKGAFMGNTAERVLTQLQCEVLTLKPKA